MGNSNKSIAGLIICILLVVSSMEAAEAGHNCWCDCLRKCVANKMVSQEKCSKECAEACEKAGYGGMPAGGAKFCKWREAMKGKGKSL